MTATSGAPGGIAAAPPSRRVAAEVNGELRWFAGVIGVGAIAYGAVLAWRDGGDGVAIASVFAVGLIALIFAMAGVVPASVKVGDLEMKLSQAEERGKQEGITEGKAQGITEGKAQGIAEGKAEGKASGALAGLLTAAEIRAAVERKEVPPDELRKALEAALSSDSPLKLSALPDTALTTPTLDVHAAEEIAAEVTEKLV